MNQCIKFAMNHGELIHTASIFYELVANQGIKFAMNQGIKFNLLWVIQESAQEFNYCKNKNKMLLVGLGAEEEKEKLPD
jgi:hypothetical protein